MSTCIITLLGIDMLDKQILEPQDWLNAGYTKHGVSTIVDDTADYMLQKLFKDAKGKRYYLSVFVYENFNKPYFKTYPQLHRYSYMPDVQFLRENSFGFNVQLLLPEQAGIAEIEHQIEQVWKAVGEPYYEYWQ